MVGLDSISSFALKLVITQIEKFRFALQQEKVEEFKYLQSLIFLEVNNVG